MEINLLNDPFPHVVIQDFYTPTELSDIKDELKFLNKPNKLMNVGTMHGGCGDTTHKALLLEDVYANRKISDIIMIFKRKYTKEFIDNIINALPTYQKLRYVNSRITKARYYFNGEKYGPHTDISRDFITLSYFHSHPRRFTGGELHCTDYNYTLDCSDNTFIMIPYYVKHEVLEVKISDDDYYNGNGRYCVTQFLNFIPNQYDKKIP